MADEWMPWHATKPGDHGTLVWTHTGEVDPSGNPIVLVDRADGKPGDPAQMRWAMPKNARVRVVGRR